MVGRADDHGIDILARQHLAIIARGRRCSSVDFFGVREAAVVDIADRHQFHAGDGKRVAGIAAAHAAVAYGGDADAIVGRDARLRLRESGGRGGREEV